MRYSYKASLLLFVVVYSSNIFGMRETSDDGYDLESGLTSATSASYQVLHDALEPVNPVNRKRSAWTDFYTVAGGMIGTGITAPVIWHFAHVAGDEAVSDAMPIVALSGTFLASLGVCCYFLTRGADIVHTTCDKAITLIKGKKSNSNE